MCGPSTPTPPPDHGGDRCDGGGLAWGMREPTAGDGQAVDAGESVQSAQSAQSARSADVATVNALGEQGERERVERFLAAFNVVDRLLRSLTGMEDHGLSFRGVLRKYAHDHRWRHAETMEDYTDLRNLLVHETLSPEGWLAVPSVAVVERLEAIREELAGRPRADQAFRREVAYLSRTTRLREALLMAHQTGYSQFPVTHGGKVEGLLTERAIARWLAARAADPARPSLTKAVEEATVAEVLRVDQGRETWRLAARDQPADLVLAAFVETPTLEAVLITEHGRADQRLLGIATHLDVVSRWNGS